MFISPTKILKPGPTIAVYGRKTGGKVFNWSMHKLREDGDIDSNRDLFRALTAVSRHLGTLGILAPIPTSSNKIICRKSDLSVKLKQPGSSTVYRGIDADGCIVPPNFAFAIASADCPTLVLWSGQKLVCVHCSRDSLIDWECVQKLSKINNHTQIRLEWKSAIRNALLYFSKRELSNLQYFTVCGIAGRDFEHSFDDQKRGKRNMMMVAAIESCFGRNCFVSRREDGALDLAELISTQLLVFGNILPARGDRDWVDTYGDKGIDNEYLYWSYRRGDGDCRNLIVVMNDLKQE